MEFCEPFVGILMSESLILLVFGYFQKANQYQVWDKYQVYDLHQDGCWDSR
jgi:hypothetical protein